MRRAGRRGWRVPACRALTAVDGEIGVGRHDFEGALSHGVAVFTASGEEGAGTGEQGDEKMLMHGEKSWEMNY